MRSVVLSGGVGGARLARGFEPLVDVDTTVVVNVGDDERIYGLEVSPDLDTVVYTIAGVQGEQGWGRAQDSVNVMTELARFGVDTSFTIGDRDMALNVFRTAGLASGIPLSKITEAICTAFGVRTRVSPVTDHQVRTEVHLSATNEWCDFQTYFVSRGHQDPIDDVRFVGADSSHPAPGVLDAIKAADLVVIAPSNPILSIWPILAVPGIEQALRDHHRVIAVSPLIGGKAVKGPTTEVLAGLGFAADLGGVLASYRGVVDEVVVDESDGTPEIDLPALSTNTVMKTPEQSQALAREIVEWR